MEMEGNGNKINETRGLKTFEECRSLRYGRTLFAASPRTKSLSRSTKKKWVAPDGHFFVHVGPEKKRFMIKTRWLNHPHFKLLLDQAETEYGYGSEGPLELPCDVGFFHWVLQETGEEALEAPWCSVMASTMHDFTKESGGFLMLNKFSKML